MHAIAAASAASWASAVVFQPMPARVRSQTMRVVSSSVVDHELSGCRVRQSARVLR
jgi:hypothetical protein